MWLSDWRQSDKSAWAYAKANGLNAQTIKKWIKAETEPKACFVEVPSDSARNQVTKSQIVIKKGDVKILVPPGITVCELRSVIESLRAAI